MNKYETRTNRELKKDFQKQIKYADEYNISIEMLHIDTQLELTVFLDVDGETSVDCECIMTECGDEPSKEMVKKAKAECKYFRQHFRNVELNEKVTYV